MFSVKLKLSRHTEGGGGPSQMTHGGGGSKIGKKVSRII